MLDDGARARVHVVDDGALNDAAAPVVEQRLDLFDLTQLFPMVQPVPVQEQRSSLFPGTALKKPANERDISLHL